VRLRTGARQRVPKLSSRSHLLRVSPIWTNSAALQHVHPEVTPHLRPPALNLPSVPDHADMVADEVRLCLDRRHDEGDVRLGERVAELPLLPAQKLGKLRIA
jgi:hypothetical protein